MDIWEQLQQLEEAEGAAGGEQEEMYEAYQEFAPEEGEGGVEEDADEVEFSEFVSQDPEEFGFSYTQLQHIGFGDPGLGTTIAGSKFSKLAKIVQTQSVAKETLYINKLKADLHKYFSFDNVNHWTSVIKNKVPRFWLKNSPTLAATAYMIDSLHKQPLTADLLAKYSTETGFRREDLLRYYRMFK